MENNILIIHKNVSENDYLKFNEFIKNDKISCFISIANIPENLIDFLMSKYTVVYEYSQALPFIRIDYKKTVEKIQKTKGMTFPILLVTRSIFEVQEMEGNNIYIFRDNGNNIIIERKLIKKGLSIESIYNMYFDGNGEIFSTETESKLSKFYKLLAKVKKADCSENTLKSFDKIKNELLDYSEEIKVIISREITQLERGK